MQKPLRNYASDLEEQRTLKWFLILFYLIMITYDAFYYFFIPSFIVQRKIGFPSVYNYLTYLLVFSLLPIARYLIKKNYTTLIKYIYFISYTLISLIVELINFYGTNGKFNGGNVVEVFLLLFAPLFINSKYFWLVSLGIAAKYILIGFSLKSSIVLVPLILIIILSVMSYISLSRFKGYVNSIRNSYDEQLEGIVKGVIAALELKDPYTRGHSERVASYALILAKLIGGFSDVELKSFNYACLLHDIGKVNIPDKILMKNGKLTIEEFEIIKSHPAVGADAVKNVDGLKKHISVIRSHHERWDGKGYPDQLYQKDIPILARITSVADAFDAMTSSRSYRAAMPVEEAYKRILDASGTQFDPAIVVKFKEIYPEWIKLHEQSDLEKAQ